MEWIYTVGIANPQIEEQDCLNTVKAYCLGDKFGIPQLKNNVLEALARANIPKTTTTSESAIYAFEHTIRGSGLRTMLTDILATSIQDGAIVLNGTTARSSSDGSVNFTWPDFFEGGGEYVSAVLSRFVGGNAVKCWTTKGKDHLQHAEAE